MCSVYITDACPVLCWILQFPRCISLHLFNILPRLIFTVSIHAIGVCCWWLQAWSDIREILSLIRGQADTSSCSKEILGRQSKWRTRWKWWHVCCEWFHSKVQGPKCCNVEWKCRFKSEEKTNFTVGSAVYVLMYVKVNVNENVNVYMYAYMYVYMYVYVYVYMYVYKYAYMYVYMCVCMNICIYVCLKFIVSIFHIWT